MIELGNFQDNAILHPLGHYAPEMSETKAVRVARKLFYKGHEGAGLAPLATSTISSMHQQLQQDLAKAKSLVSDSPAKKADLDRLEKTIQYQYGHLAIPKSHGKPARTFSAPGM